MQFHIPNMECGGCVRGVTKAIHSIDPQATIQADPPARRISVTSQHSGAAFLPALEAAGFPATLQQGATP